MLDQLIELGKKIEERESEKKLAFPEICYQELQSLKVDITLPEFEKEITSSILNNPIVNQLTIHNNFGQPPLTIFNNKNFVIDIYFWLHHDTSIHDHSFEGAFKVLFGSSLQETFEVNFLKNFASDVATTELKKLSSEFLYIDDVVKITRGENFTHRLIHLEVPTITLCIRSINDELKNQWHHFSNGLSIEKKIISPSTLKKFYYCEYLLLRQINDFQTTLKDLISNLEISVVMNFYEQMATHCLSYTQEFCQSFYESIESLYSDQLWFREYQNFYQSLDERYLEFESDSPITRLIEHANNTMMSKSDVTELITKYKNTPPTIEELELIEAIFLN